MLTVGCADWAALTSCAPAGRRRLRQVLTQELGRVNGLLSVIRSTLIDLQKAVKGLVLMSAELEAVGRAMYDGKVPAAWLKRSFPSLKPLGSFVREARMPPPPSFAPPRLLSSSSGLQREQQARTRFRFLTWRWAAARL